MKYNVMICNVKIKAFPQKIHEATKCFLAYALYAMNLCFISILATCLLLYFK